jgi:hypothetical protein
MAFAPDPYPCSDGQLIRFTRSVPVRMRDKHQRRHPEAGIVASFDPAETWQAEGSIVGARIEPPRRH